MAGVLSVGRPRCKHQPSETGGVTQPYFSCVFTKLLKVASASLRLKDFFDLPAFLQMRPCVRGKRNQVRTPAGNLFLPPSLLKPAKLWSFLMPELVRCKERYGALQLWYKVDGGVQWLASFWGRGEAGGCCLHKPRHWLLPQMLLPRHRKASSTSS